MAIGALRHQPIKSIYVVYRLLSLVCFHLPLWILVYIPPSSRPRPTWTLKQSLWVRLLQYIYQITTKVGRLTSFPTHLSIAPGVHFKGVWVDPVPKLVNSELAGWAAIGKVEPIRIPGYWIDKKGHSYEVGQCPAPGEKVVYCLHGGAYISLSAYPKDPTAAIARGLLKHIASAKRAFSIEYRLSRHDPYPRENPFPAALLDALAGYNYLINVVGYAPENVILEGDSAGGNLALALTRYLVENQKATDVKLPVPPSTLILSSPWPDMSDSHHTDGSSTLTFHTSDYLPQIFKGEMIYAERAFVGPHGPNAAETNRYISPACKRLDVSFAGFPRTFITAGGAEMLRDQIRTLKGRMEADLGGDVYFYEAPDACHDFLIFDWQEPYRTEALRRIGKWVDAA